MTFGQLSNKELFDITYSEDFDSLLYILGQRIEILESENDDLLIEIDMLKNNEDGGGE